MISIFLTVIMFTYWDGNGTFSWTVVFFWINCKSWAIYFKDLWGIINRVVRCNGVFQAKVASKVSKEKQTCVKQTILFKRKMCDCFQTNFNVILLKSVLLNEEFIYHPCFVLFTDFYGKRQNTQLNKCKKFTIYQSMGQIVSPLALHFFFNSMSLIWKFPQFSYRLWFLWSVGKLCFILLLQFFFGT